MAFCVSINQAEHFHFDTEIHITDFSLLEELIINIFENKVLLEGFLGKKTR